MKGKNMMMVTIIGFLMISTITSSSVANVTPENTKNVLESYNDLKITLETDQTSYRWLIDPVEITLTVENTGSEEIELEFPTTQMHDFEVLKYKYNRSIFKWSDGKIFLQVITKIILEPGSQASWEYTWRQRGRLFQHWFYRPVLPGEYIIKGTIPTINNTYEATTSINITFGLHIFR